MSSETYDDVEVVTAEILNAVDSVAPLDCAGNIDAAVRGTIDNYTVHSFNSFPTTVPSGIRQAAALETADSNTCFLTLNHSSPGYIGGLCDY